MISTYGHSYCETCCAHCSWNTLKIAIILVMSLSSSLLLRKRKIHLSQNNGILLLINVSFHQSCHYLLNTHKSMDLKTSHNLRNDSKTPAWQKEYKTATPHLTNNIGWPSWLSRCHACHSLRGQLHCHFLIWNLSCTHKVRVTVRSKWRGKALSWQNLKLQIYIQWSSTCNVPLS